MPVEFSNIASVTTQGIVSNNDLSGIPQSGVIALPVFVEDNVDVAAFNLQMLNNALQSVQANNTSTEQPCIACSINGSLEIICLDNCYVFNVAVTEDINSITVDCPSTIINFQFPPHSTFKVCGFPVEFGLEDNCAESIVAGNSPVTQTTRKVAVNEDSIEPHQECEYSATRYPANGCLDYIQDCYDKGSYIAVTNRTTATKNQLGGRRATGCVGGDVQRFFSGPAPRPPGQGNPINLLVKSGNLRYKKTLTPNPLAGFSVWYGNVSGQNSFPNGPVALFAGAITINSKPVGKPIFGLAFHVLENSTVQHFTGWAWLVNYRIRRQQIVRYVNSSIRDGTPTIIAESTIMPDDLFEDGFPINMELETWGDGVNDYAFMYSLAPGANNVLDIFGGTPLGNIAPGETIGVGYIWVGNPDYGIHSIEVGHTSLTTNFNFWG